MGILSDVISALHYLHRRKVIHRCISADNILVDKKGRAYIMNFADSAKITLKRSARQSLIGNFHYMAPEVFI